MPAYLILLRGINVGGKNKVPMAALRTCLEGLGFENVSTYIASGNAILDSKKSAAAVKAAIEAALPNAFKLDSDLIAVAVLTKAQLKAIVDDRPKGFGDEPGKYHSDALFLMGITAAKTPNATLDDSPRPNQTRKIGKTAANGRARPTVTQFSLTVLKAQDMPAKVPPTIPMTAPSEKARVSSRMLIWVCSHSTPLDASSRRAAKVSDAEANA